MNNTGFDAWALSLIVFLPLVGALIVMLIPKQEEIAIKTTALLATLASFAVTVYVLINFTVDILYSVLDPRIRHARAAA